MTIHIYFFGCSYTAGDELSDEKYFPWKFTEQHTASSYYEKRRLSFDGGSEFGSQYIEDNKKLAYPAQITLDNIQTYEHAINGKSLRQNIFEIVYMLENNKPMDAVYIQLPPAGREMYLFDNGFITSFQYAFNNKTDAWYQYVLEKQMSHNYMQNSLEDILDLIMVAGYLKNKNVYFKLITIGDELELRKNDVRKIEKFTELISAVGKLPIIEFDAQDDDRLLGGHLSKEAHKKIAKLIEDDICQNITIK